MPNTPDFTEEELTAFIAMAEKQDFDAFRQHTVKMNVFKLDALINAAAIELARLYKDQAVMFLLRTYLKVSGDSCPYAAEDLAGRIYARAGRQDKFDELVTSGGLLGAIYAYAYAGMFESVNLYVGCILPREYANPDLARLKKLEAEVAYYESGVFADDDKLLRMLSHTHDDSFRRQMAMSVFINKRDPASAVCDRDQLLERATAIHGYMRSYKLNYEQALALYPKMQKIKESYPDGVVASLFAGTLFCDVRDKIDAETNAVESVRNSQAAFKVVAA